MTTVLRVKDLTVDFGGLRALDDVALSVDENELRAIIGPNGAGKSTLFNAVGGEVRTTWGSVEVLGRDVTRTAPHRLRQIGLARGYQIPQVFGGMSVRDNLWMSRIAGTRTRLHAWKRARRLVRGAAFVEEVAAEVGLVDVLDQSAEDLSHADQKVLDIGIALAMQPRLLLLDEPTQGISPEEVERIHDVIRRATERATVLMIEHNMDTVVELSDHVTVLARGRVIADGPPAEVAQDPQVQEVYMGVLPAQGGTDARRS